MTAGATPNATKAYFDSTLGRVADIRGLEVKQAPPYMDEGASLVKDFYAELQSLERQNIGVEGRSWVSPIVADILRITGELLN